MAEKMKSLKSLGVISPEDLQQTMERLMAAVEKVEPPHELDA